MSTITPTQSVSASAPLASPEIYRIAVDEYERMAGALNDPRVELIDGYLVRKMGKQPPHIWVVRSILQALGTLLPNGWTCSKEDPVRIPEFDEPEPDVAVIRGSKDDYRVRIPEPGDVTLVIEVSESTLDRDQGKKLDAYAKGGIPIYWIVNLVHRRVELYTGPGPGGYSSCELFTAGADVPVVINGALVGRIAVSDILP
jgi:Uma2 family endonuclease